MPLDPNYVPDFQGRRFICYQDYVNVRMNATVNYVCKKDLTAGLSPRFRAEQDRRLGQLYLWPPSWLEERGIEPDFKRAMDQKRSSEAAPHTRVFPGDHEAASTSYNDSIIPQVLDLPRKTPQIPEQLLLSQGGDARKRHLLKLQRAASTPELPRVKCRCQLQANGRPPVEEFSKFDLIHKRPVPGTFGFAGRDTSAWLGGRTVDPAAQQRPSDAAGRPGGAQETTATGRRRGAPPRLPIAAEAVGRLTR